MVESRAGEMMLISVELQDPGPASVMAADSSLRQRLRPDRAPVLLRHARCEPSRSHDFGYRRGSRNCPSRFPKDEIYIPTLMPRND
jgi:hypothetical protein